jgi:gamma-glutamylputrescine oxidase
MNSKYLIIGAGIAGMSLSHWLRNAGESDLIHIDERGLAEGSSGLNAGFLTCGSAIYLNSLVLKWGLKRASYVKDLYLETLRELPKLLNKSIESLECGSLTHNFIDTQNLQKLNLKYEIKGEDLFLPYDSQVNSPQVLKELAHDISWNEKAINIQKLDKGFRVLTSKREIECEKVVVTTNAWISELLPELSKVVSYRAQMISFETNERFIDCNHYIPHDRVYFRQKGASEFWIGGLRGLDLESEKTREIGLNQKIQSALESKARELYPQLGKVKKQWAGLLGVTKSELPEIGKTKDGIYYLGGFSGHGMGLAFSSARALSELILGSSSR